jgi:uncharacterized membrane protein YbaN (DUF454 family)
VEAVAEAGFPAQHRPVVGLVHVVFAYVDYVAVGELLTLRQPPRYTLSHRHPFTPYLQLFTNQHALVKNEHVTAFNSLIVVSFDFQFAVFDQSPVVCQSLICGVPLDDVLLQVVDHCQVFAVSGGLVYEPCHIQHGLSSSPQIIVLLVILQNTNKTLHGRLCRLITHGICMFDQLVQEQMVLEDPLHGHRQHVPQLEPPVVVLLFVRLQRSQNHFLQSDLASDLTTTIVLKPSSVSHSSCKRFVERVRFAQYPPYTRNLSLHFINVKLSLTVGSRNFFSSW